ncbi:glycosyltransferase [Cohnella lubricantis]|uniref:UDP-N-acetylglucosamine--LPS N-acetylglucosamine transferase n=1 Tax=Cohnella lubricantis TaxID=2163172 RepID=A0A841T9G4_9BACL|nr:glycosyltransferase [Cohnella lubricantis]MBB6676676.1 UDP-N-acetylglucosamine--LPS N-acetylglucosamine transferase [Cohnella lubricantis]MBP2120607.1 processive 1,2-diacylglycerol beta-glucosyltransferase [Cohnella lubricantis]
MRKKRVLLLSEGFGTGHTQAAYALSVGLRQLSPNLQTRVIELGTFLNPIIGPLILSAYRKTVTKQPKLVGKIYKSYYDKGLNRVKRFALHRLFYNHVSDVIEQLKPDIIICTHPFPNAVVSRLKRLGLQVPLFTVITDYDAHATWTNPEVDKYLVSTSIVRDKLVARGIASEQVEVTGIPVHPNFWSPHDRAEILSQFELSDMPTVLIMGGGWGLLYSDQLVEYMTTYANRVQLILCMGSNDKAREKLMADPRFQHPNIKVLGFTREVSKLMDVSELLVTKPGGMTCTEGMAKGIPMLFYEPIPGQEEENLDYFVTHGFGELLTSTETVDRWFRLIQEPYAAGQHRDSLLALRNAEYKPAKCAESILQLLKQS